MDRRDFLKTLAAGAVLASLPRSVHTLAAKAAAAPWNPAAIARISVSPDAAEINFCFVGDTHVPFDDAGVVKKIIKKVNEIGPDIMLHGGDGVQVGNKENFNAFMRAIKKFDMPFIMAPGNHDTAFSDYSDLSEWIPRFGGPYYYFDAGPARFVMLNNGNFDLGTEQWAFFEKALDTDRFKVVVQHRPVAGLNDKYGTPMHDSERYMELVRRHGVRLVLCGHEHHYARYERDGAVFIVSGGGGGALNSSMDGLFHHFMHLSIKDGQLIEEVVKV